MKKFISSRFILCLVSIAALGVVVGATTLQDGGNPDIYYRDGARFALEGRLTEAAFAFEHVVALDPANGNAYYSLGNIYAEMGRWADAAEAYYKAVSLNKADVEAYNALGIALEMRGQYVQAASAFEKAIKIYPKWAEPYYNLSQTRRHLRQDEAAQIAYEQAIKLRPDYSTRPPLRFSPAVAKTDLSPRSEQAAAKTSPVGGFPEAIFSGPAPLAEASTRVAARPTPAETTSVATPVDSMDAGAYFDTGLNNARAGRYEEAAEAFRKAIFIDRNNAEAYRALGDAYAALGRWRESVDTYEQAARLIPNDPDIYQKLGRSYAKLRETTPATQTANGLGDGVKVAASSDSRAEAEQNKDLSASRSGAVKASDAGARGTSSIAGQDKNSSGAPMATAVDDVDPTAVYRVGPNDVLDIRVLDGRGQSTTSYQVTPTGLLAYPTLSEPLNVAGLTTEQIAARLSVGLKRQDRATSIPDVAVGVREYASHAIIVSGMVKDAGTKILQREGVPLYVIIAYAQPLVGAGQAVIAARATGRTTTVDLSDARAMKTLVRPGDVVTVRVSAEQFFYIAGTVRQPGQKKFHAELTLTQAVLAAGGVTTSSKESGIAVISRQTGDGRLASLRYDLNEIAAGKAPDPIIQAGDRIEVLR